MEFIFHIAVLAGIYVILAVTLNLVVGYTGLLSVAHASFFGIGAYTTALLTTKLGWNFFATLPLSMLTAAMAATGIGLILSKFRDDYYALVSLGFNVIVFSVLLNWRGLTRGPLGVPGIPRPELFGVTLNQSWQMLLLVAAIAVLVYFLARFLTRSSFGRVLKAIREDELAIAVFGYRTQVYKLVIFVVSAGLAGVAGSLLASYIRFIGPHAFDVFESVFILAIIILGGLANLRGSILGAIFLIALPEALRFLGFSPAIAAQMRQVIYGLLLMLLMLYRPQGLLGKFKL
jgi:branched-chain amino acid transport system permease protein